VSYNARAEKCEGLLCKNYTVSEFVTVMPKILWPFFGHGVSLKNEFLFQSWQKDAASVEAWMDTYRLFRTAVVKVF